MSVTGRIRRAGLLLALPIAAIVVAACGSSTTKTVTDTVKAPETATTPAPTPTAQSPAPSSVAAKMKAAIPSITGVDAITENNDPNNLLGRPNGYTAATVIRDSGAQRCDELGVDCGATIEEWPDHSAAEKRKAYIQARLKDNPILGNEYNTVSGRLLLRVSGNLKPSVAEAYSKEFQAATSG